MKHTTLFKTLSLSFAMSLTYMGSAYAQWGTQTTPKVIYQRTGEILGFKTARTSDGYTYMSWQEWNLDWAPASSLSMCMQLLDPDGMPMWGDDGIVIDSYPTKSYTTAYTLLVDDEGNAYVSWADSRSQVDKVLTENDERYDNFEPVIYKVNKDGEMLWGEDGKTFDTSQYSVTPILYRAGKNIYAMMYGIGAGSYIPSYFVRLDPETGDFIGTPKSMGGQFIASVGTDIINVYASGNSTMAMRYDEDLNPVWSQPTQVAPEVYSGHNNFPYNLVSDYQGGVIVSFERNTGSSKWMPIVNYIDANGESLFGHAVDVTTNDWNNNSYNYIVYNPQSENILNVWGMNNPTTALYGQLMDVFGDRMWSNLYDEDGVELAFKDNTTDYTFAPLGATFTKDNTYWILYVDETNWMQDTMFLMCIDEEGNIIEGADNSMKVGPWFTGVVSPSVYWDNGNMYLIYYNYVSTTGVYRIRTVMVPDLYEPGEIPEPQPENPDSGVGITESVNAGQATYYSVDGLRSSTPVKGLNIVKESDGSVKKIIIR